MEGPCGPVEKHACRWLRYFLRTLLSSIKLPSSDREDGVARANVIDCLPRLIRPLRFSYELLIACLRRKRKNYWRLMRDIAFILVTALFFALALLYLRGCERLK